MLSINLFTLSASGISSFAYHFKKNNSPRILILAGVHGDEIEGVIAARELINRFQIQNNYNLDILIIPEFNIAGVLNKTRGNSNGVDLNRNLPTKDWSAEFKTERYFPGKSALSEVENKAFVKLLEDYRPNFILSLHSWHPVINVNGDCQQEAEVLSKITGYKIDSDIGYPTPGCLGTYTGIERNIPTITYEIQRGQSAEDILKIHPHAICEMLKVCEQKYAK